jgi:aspartate kinase
MALVAMALHDLGVNAISFTGSQSGILTDERHANARIVGVKPDRIRAALEAARS